MELVAKAGLIGDIRGRLQRRFQRWLRQRIPPVHEIELDHRNIFILPNRQGLVFCLVLALLFVGAINYEASLGFALVFWLTGMFLISIFHTFRNLAGLELSALSGSGVFAGEYATITVILSRHGKRVHEALLLHFAGSSPVRTDLLNDRQARVSLYVPASKRGYFNPGRLTIETVFPFGICRAWSLLDLKLDCLVYPKPVACDIESLLASQFDAGSTNVRTGNDDFYSLREYQYSDSWRHVAWKNFARGQGMYTKQFSSHVDDRIWLDWDMFPGLEMEERLSRLCFCVLQLDNRQIDYGIRLPGTEIAPAKGAAHFKQVMKLLALYGKEQTET
ncbi:MAG: DUF58 domain-containing protein [Pseudohongiellaceae bacterium]